VIPSQKPGAFSAMITQILILPEDSMKHGLLILAVFVLLQFSACSSDDKHSFFYHGGPLKPDDPDFPVLNPNPVHKLRLVVSGLEPGKGRFTAHYLTDPRACGQQAGAGGYYAEGKTDAIDMSPATRKSDDPVGTANESVGWVVIDKYLPGHCGWGMQLIGYKIGRTKAEDTEGQLIVYSAQIQPSKPKTYQWDFWCYKSLKDFKTNDPTCEPLWMMLTSNGVQRHATKAFASNFSSQQRGIYPQGPFDDATEKLRVQIHDIEAIPGALVPLRYCKVQTSILPCNEGDTNFAPL
jgi:hypothetical protein